MEAATLYHRRGRMESGPVSERLSALAHAAAIYRRIGRDGDALACQHLATALWSAELAAGRTARATFTTRLPAPPSASQPAPTPSSEPPAPTMHAMLLGPLDPFGTPPR